MGAWRRGGLMNGHVTQRVASKQAVLAHAGVGEEV